jgi:uncharacterized RDD family membrane protein YckC
MSDTPPPLPVADEDAVAKAFEDARMAPPHAPLFWRTLAFLVDATLLGLIGYLLTTRVLLPEYKPDELAVFNGWISDIEKGYGELWRAVETGNEAKVSAINDSLLAKAKDTPAGAIAVVSFTSSCMTMVYWLGFTAMEYATGGASLGKKIFRLRVARFPHGEKPGLLDTVIRSGWKAMAVGSINPFIMLFAVIDAHWPLFNPLRRSLHDVMCRTLVLDARFDPPEAKKPDEEEDED